MEMVDSKMKEVKTRNKMRDDVKIVHGKQVFIEEGRDTDVFNKQGRSQFDEKVKSRD